MSEKDIKTKPKTAPKINEKTNIPKMAVKSKEAVANTVKDAKAVMKDTLVKKAIETKSITEQEQSQPQKADTEAAENIESAVYTSADTVYHKGKTFTQNKIKEYQTNKVKTREEYLNNHMDNLADQVEQTQTEPNIPKEKAGQVKTREISETPNNSSKQSQNIKTKQQYIKAQKEQSSQLPSVKTKENYIKQHSSPEETVNGVSRQKITSQTVKTREYINGSEETIQPKSANDARKEYVQNKVKDKKNEHKKEADYVSEKEYHSPKTKETYQASSNKNTLEVNTKDSNLSTDKSISNPKGKVDNIFGSEKVDLKSGIKTKENYMQSLRHQQFEVDNSKNSPAFLNRKTKSISSDTSNAKKAIKTRQSYIGKNKSILKSGNIYTSKTAKRKVAKNTRKAVKTQKEITKKAAKEAAKRSKQAAQKAAQVAKAAAVKTAKVAVVIGKAVAAAAAKLISALAALGGWAVLIVVLIVIIIIAAIAGSPFGIFISDEAADSDSIPISSIVAECNIELSTKLDNIESSTVHDRVIMEGEQADWGLVLSLFAVKVAGVEDETVEDVVVITEEKKQKLKDVFWDIHALSSRTETISSRETNETVLYITINTKTKEEMINQYNFSHKQIEALETLLDNADGYIGATQSLAISDATAKGVIDSLPDNLSSERKNVIKAACSLVGKVNYFWGGKSSAIGWDSRWGKMTLVTAAGSHSSGSMRPFGLDCSGFVTWSFINAGMSANDIGHGTQGQIGKCSRISWNNAQPGDLAFLSDLSHVGIVAGKDESGNILVIHCSSGANNVVITSNSIFGFAARPHCY